MYHSHTNYIGTYSGLIKKNSMLHYLITFFGNNSVFLIPVAFIFRIVASRGELQSFDSHGHLYFATELKNQNQGPFGTIKTKVVEGTSYTTPFLWHWIIALFPLNFIRKYQKYWNSLIDALFAFLIYEVCKLLGLDQTQGMLAFAIYVFTPMWFSRVSLGPRIGSFTPRLSGEVVTNIFFMSVCLPFDVPIYTLYIIGILSSFYVLASSKFGIQALLFLTPIISLIAENWLPLNVLLLSIIMVILVSKGKFLNSLKHQILHLTLYFAKNLKGEVSVANRNRIDKLYYQKKNERITFYLFRLLNTLVARNSYFGVIVKLPVLWLTLLIYINANTEVPKYLWAPVLASIIVYFLINLPPLLFLGEAERYLNHVATFIILMSVWNLDNLYTSVLLFLIIYGLTYLILEAFLLPIVNKKQSLIEVDTTKIIDFLCDLKNSTVLCYPYHAAGGVYKIMADTPHTVLFTAATSQSLIEKLEKKYPSAYPYADISKIDQMHFDFDINILIANSEALKQRELTMSEITPNWKEIDLGLSLHRVFIHKDFSG